MKWLNCVLYVIFVSVIWPLCAAACGIGSVGLCVECVYCLCRVWKQLTHYLLLIVGKVMKPVALSLSGKLGLLGKTSFCVCVYIPYTLLQSNE